MHGAIGAIRMIYGLDKVGRTDGGRRSQSPGRALITYRRTSPPPNSARSGSNVTTSLDGEANWRRTTWVRGADADRWDPLESLLAHGRQTGWPRPSSASPSLTPALKHDAA